MAANNPHRRTLSSKSLKAQRPVLARGPSSPKLQSLGKRRTTEVETALEDADGEDLDMTFLQYCPACEKQILIPNSSILYCSESCRRKDGAYRPSSTSLDSLMISDSEDSSIAPRTIVQPRSPSTFATFNSKPPLLHGFKPDLDPTEWKPDSPFPSEGSEDASGLPHHTRSRSAAFNFLSQFHSSTASFLANRRPALLSRASTSAVTLSRTAPTASTTPAMSVGNSTSSDGSGFLRTPDNGIVAGPQLCPSGRMFSDVRSVDPVRPVLVGKNLIRGAVSRGEEGFKELGAERKAILSSVVAAAAGEVAVAGCLG